MSFLKNIVQTTLGSAISGAFSGAANAILGGRGMASNSLGSIASGGFGSPFGMLRPSVTASVIGGAAAGGLGALAAGLGAYGGIGMGYNSLNRSYF